MQASTLAAGWLGVTPEQLDAMEDDAYVDTIGRAMWFEDRVASLIARSVRKGIVDAFKGG